MKCLFEALNFCVTQDNIALDEMTKSKCLDSRLKCGAYLPQFALCNSLWTRLSFKAVALLGYV